MENNINDKDKGLLMILTQAGYINAKQFKKAKKKIKKNNDLNIPRTLKKIFKSYSKKDCDNARVKIYTKIKGVKDGQDK